MHGASSNPRRLPSYSRIAAEFRAVRPSCRLVIAVLDSDSACFLGF
jgi:hypothetical protein